MRPIIIFIILAISPLFLFSQQYTDIDKKARSTPFSKDHLRLAHELTEEYQDEVSKTRAIFTWLAHHISYDNSRRENFKKTGKRTKTKFVAKSEAGLEQQKQKMIQDNINQTLANKKGVCQDYAWVFQAMLEEIGIECAFVSGFGRFSPNNIGKIHKKGNHAWNAVKINSKWELMDVTWSTGMGAIQNFGDGFFMVPPEIFLLSHYPDEDRWQLMEQPIDKETFSKQPFMHAGFMSSNIRSITPSTGKVSRKDVFTIEVALKENQSIAIFKARKISKNEMTRTGDKYSIDLSKTRLLGNVDFVIIEKGQVTPLITIKVR